MKHTELKYIVDDNGCWRCTSHKLCKGYVRIVVDGKAIGGHRLSYMLKYGEITQPVIRHTCDNTWCINPDHLLQGTQSDNTHDKIVRGRNIRPYNSKLTNDLIVEIYKNTSTHNAELSRIYKVSKSTISDIKNKRKCYKLIIDRAL